MTDVRTTNPTAATDFREITDEDRRLFARYLVRQGWFSDHGPTRQNHDDRPLPELLREIDELVARRRRALDAVR